MLWQYLLVFIGTILVDLVPVIGPPAWTVMVFLQVHYDLNIWIVLIVGVIGSTIGRYCLSVYIPKITDKILKQEKNEDLEFLGEKLSQKRWRSWLFVFVYTLVPLPSTPIFTAAGIARVKPVAIIPAFFAGKFISDALMVISGKVIVTSIKDMKNGMLSWQSILFTAIGILLICGLLFIDWKTLLTEKKLTFKFKVLKGSK
jgi:membrane protein DedA with SNARE-associated domain